jgi:hypothetical protein
MRAVKKTSTICQYIVVCPPFLSFLPIRIPFADEPVVQNGHGSKAKDFTL